MISVNRNQPSLVPYGQILYLDNGSQLSKKSLGAYILTMLDYTAKAQDFG